MPIPLHLNDQDLMFECPSCRGPIIRKGSWFKSISSFSCPACKTALRLGYPEKLHLFESYKRRAEKNGADGQMACPVKGGLPPSRIEI
ncbi:hypothetical protein ACVDG8_007660 [Mesorhizobium sp. ORM8.1]